MNILFDEQQTKDLVTGALLASLGPEKRDKLIGEAIKSLLDPNGYGRKTSVVQDAFEDAAKRVATDYIEGKLTADEAFKSQVSKMIEEAVERVMVINREQTISRMAEALVRAMGDGR